MVCLWWSAINLLSVAIYCADSAPDSSPSPCGVLHCTYDALDDAWLSAAPDHVTPDTIYALGTVTGSQSKSSGSMRPLNFSLLAGVASCVLAGCEKPAVNNAPSSALQSVAVKGTIPELPSRPSISDEVSGPIIAAAEAIALNEDSTSSPLDLITTKIDTTITLGAWMKSHPSDKISEVPPVYGINDPFCRGAVAQTHLLGRPLARYAMFYIPPLSKADRLPTDTARASDHCELRTVVLVSEEMDSARGNALRDSLAQLVQSRLGPAGDGLPLGAGGVRGTRDGLFWNGSATKVVVATGPVDREPNSATRAPGEEEEVGAPAGDSTQTVLSRAYALGYAPGSGAQDFDTWESRYNAASGQRVADQQQKYSDVDSALVWAGVPSVSSDINTVLDFLKNRDPENIKEVRPREVDVALLRALRTIHDVAPKLPPPRRAAVLMAGEVTLFAALSVASADSERTVHRTLDSLGISFSRHPGQEDAGINHVWLWQAWQIDSTGRAGRAAFVRLLGLWWPVSDECNSHEYAGMIEAGEAELKRGDRNPAIYFYVGSAYKSIWDFAHFYIPEEVEAPESVKRQAESARLKGIEYFRAAVQSLPEGEMRRDAWAKGMALMMRRSGEQPEYVCLPD
jgi:hypothetical protein